MSRNITPAFRMGVSGALADPYLTLYKGTTGVQHWPCSA